MDYEKLIKGKEKELSDVKSELEIIKNKFIQATIKFSSGWYNRTAEDEIATQSNITLTLGKEKLTALKGELEELISKTEDITNREISNEKNWWHLSDDAINSQTDYLTVKRDSERSLKESVLKILSKLEEVLTKSGYDLYRRYRGFRGVMLSFPISVEWPDEMTNILKDYSALLRRAIPIASELNKLKQERDKRNARNLWETI